VIPAGGFLRDPTKKSVDAEERVESARKAALVGGKRRAQALSAARRKANRARSVETAVGDRRANGKD
jgi:hypothetical protein